MKIGWGSSHEGSWTRRYYQECCVSSSSRVEWEYEQRTPAGHAGGVQQDASLPDEGITMPGNKCLDFGFIVM